ncbi:hypothetical protein GCM10011505_06750 [Tistrella bauzanensis]|uniref:Type-4 uracil-DNA glycosylase n=1 Tax=Tistrella bauzanensis TaxID=657419 RepID=A0ABQ1I8U5_9PROT|nr:UdgX family uracil-DNA binding protein [Tistrella bauzanensis]GGB28137.1 hypothetical protein GCM10011505_06750 [Tistrella bauzanensis]
MCPADRHADWPDDPPVQPVASLAAARRLAAGCRRCDLWRGASRTVFGDGADGHAAPSADRSPHLMLVGEQPGDKEDLAGHPFVGPAGRILDQALEAAGIDRARIYLTNAVKHFKNEPRGKRRLHRRPDAGEIDRCRWWLDLERQFVRPRVMVALGASAARAVLGRAVTISRSRGRFWPLDAREVAPATEVPATMALVTVHPSFILRQRDRPGRDRAWRQLVEDLSTAREGPVAPHTANGSEP